MVGFKSKKISNSPTLSEKIKEARQTLGISLKEAAEETSISLKYLEALESGQLSLLPGEVYSKSFLKVYTKFLGLNTAELLNLYETEQRLYRKAGNRSGSDFKKPVERVSRAHLIVTPKIARGVIILILALACLSYLGVKVRAIITPPNLIVEQPANNLVTADNFIEIVGMAEKETILEINGQQVLTNPEGYFSELIDLQQGSNVIEIKATKRHGKETKIYRQVVVVDSEDKKEELSN